VNQANRTLKPAPDEPTLANATSPYYSFTFKTVSNYKQYFHERQLDEQYHEYGYQRREPSHQKFGKTKIFAHMSVRRTSKKKVQRNFYATL